MCGTRLFYDRERHSGGADSTDGKVFIDDNLFHALTWYCLWNLLSPLPSRIENPEVRTITEDAYNILKKCHMMKCTGTS